MPSPSCHLRPPAIPPQAPSQEQIPSQGGVSPRKLRRTAAVSNLKAAALTSEEHDSQQLPPAGPRTPEQSRPTLHKQHSKLHNSPDIERGFMSNDSSYVQLASGKVFDLDKALSSLEDEERLFDQPAEGQAVVAPQRHTSGSTVIIHRQRSCDLSDLNADKEMLELNDDGGIWNTNDNGIYVGRKRGRSDMEGSESEDEEEAENRGKKARSSSASTQVRQSCSPSPPQRNGLRVHKSGLMRTRSEPRGHTRRESIENDPTQARGANAVRRVWSGEDVLHALSTGRAEGRSSGTTPPASPTVHPVVTQVQAHTLPSPKMQQPKLARRPLSNITDEFVPDFVKPTTPTLSAQDEPTTPGHTFQCLSDGFLSHKDDSELTLVGFDGASESKTTAKTNELDNETINSELSDDLEDAGEDGKAKQPIISHVLRGLDNDARFLQDALMQVKLLKEKVEKHDRQARNTKRWLEDHKVATLIWGSS